MNSFTKNVTAFLQEILYINDTVKIATILITNNESHYISSKMDLPTNFTNLCQYAMISGSSWVFNKKDKGGNDAYARFWLKSQVNTEEIVNQVLFEFSCLDRKTLYKKQHQTVKTETPLMLLFVCNGTDQASITADAKQMLDTALDNIEQNGMLPEEFENKDIPYITHSLKVLRLPAKMRLLNNKGCNHYKEHGKKAFHFKVAKEVVKYFKYLSAQMHRMNLDVKHFGNFAKFMRALGNNTPLSDCTHLRRCIQGHLNYHLSSTSITINEIRMLDASEYLRNPANRKSIV
jgi:hypothetical protein